MLNRKYDPTPPMPLKHATETMLVFLLGAVIALTGFLAANLPLLPKGIWPWSLLFVLSLLYPLFMSPTFRRDRADYSFRLLHWIPMAILLIWFILQSVALYLPSFDPLLKLFVWGWTFPAVLLGFVLVLSFCLHVIRRREQRVALLLAAFVPFTVLGVMSEVGNNDWNKQIASTLWEGGVWNMVQSGGLVIGQVIDEEPKNGTGEVAVLDPSEDAKEEAWRERLRAIEQRRERIEDRIEEMQEKGETIEVNVSGDTTNSGALRDTMTKPNTLTDSGPVMGSIGLTMMGMYCGVLHARVRKRNQLSA